MNENKMKWRAQVAAILKNLQESNMYSQLVVDCKQDDPFFEDSCKFVELHHELMKFRDFLLSSNRYEEIASQS